MTDERAGGAPQRCASQRRIEDAVGGVGVIESGLPSRVVTRKDSHRRSSDLVSERSSAISQSGARGRGTVRTNRRISVLVGGRGWRGTGDEVMPEGRARVVKCEVAERRFCGAMGTGSRKTILHPVRVDVPPGSITAILGTSESGKSTLLKFLAGCMDKNVIYEGAVNFPGQLAYLPRETYLHRFYTARSYIQHYDRLISSGAGSGGCMPNRGDNVDGSNISNAVDNTSGRRLYRRNSSVSSIMTTNDIENLLDSLRIDRDRRDTIVGDAFGRGLNPGEKRRLELGLLVLGAPDALFCENPVEGLDSETSLHVMEFLKGYISNSNRRVIVTLNKPSQFIWSLIDNVILLSKGRVVYEGPRFDMESFFAFHKRPTPARFSPLEHYLAVISNFRQSNAAVNWEAAFKQWQEEADADEGDDLADDIEMCFPTAIPSVHIPQLNPEGTGDERTQRRCFGGRFHKFCELLRRYTLNMLRNPGALLVRLVMYTVLSLILGVLFFNLQHDDSYQAVNSRAALLFYSSSFYIFMVVAVLPFLAHDLQIRDKETLNGFYRPITHHLAMSLASIPAVLLLALVISLILVGMVKLQHPVNFFIVLALALWCAESSAFLMSLCVSNYIIGTVLLAGLFGVAMPVEGFMLVPSKFPLWLEWTYFVPFHTYTWRSLMYNEFANTPSGNAVLSSYEIQDTNIRNDMIVLLFYSVAIHLASLGILLLGRQPSSMAQKMKAS